MPKPGHSRRWLATVTLASLAGVSLLGYFLYRQSVTRLTPQEAQVQAVFTASDGPCRRGDRTACLPGVLRLRALRDFPDGSLLLGDYNIARYLLTLPDGQRLEARWSRDRITAAQLLAFGDSTYARNMPVCRSFWMYAQIKNEHVATPQFVIGGAQQ